MFMSIMVLRALNEEFIFCSESDMRAFREIFRAMLTCKDEKHLMSIEFDTIIDADLVTMLQKIKGIRIGELKDLKYEEDMREKEVEIGLKLNYFKISNELL